MRGLIQIPDTILIRKFILFFFIVLGFIHVLTSYTGSYGSDDVNYARAAAKVINARPAEVSAPDHYHQLRWSVVYSAAICYKIFGVNDLSSALPAIIAFALTGWLILKMTRRSVMPVFLLSMILFFLNRTVVFFQYRLLPDPIMCFAVVWMYYCYRSHVLEKMPAIRSALIFTIAFFLALITKETVIIIFPLFLFFLINDFIKKQHLGFWKIAVPSVLAVFFLYMLYFKITTGDFLYRYHLIISAEYKNVCSFDQLPFIHTLRRIGYQLWQSFLFMGDMMLILPAVAGWIHRKKLNSLVPQIDHTTVIILLLSANFMTISISSYIPLCHDNRHFIFILPVCVLVAAPTLFAYFKNPTAFPAVPLLMCLAAVVMFATGEGNIKYVYALFSLLLLAFYILHRSRHPDRIWIPLALTAAIFFINYLKDYVKPMYSYYHDNKQIIEDNFGSGTVNATVVSSDPLSSELNELFLGFDTRNTRFISVNANPLPADSVYFYHLNRSINPDQAEMFDSIKKASPVKDIELISSRRQTELYRVSKNVLLGIRRGLQ